MGPPLGNMLARNCLVRWRDTLIYLKRFRAGSSMVSGLLAISGIGTSRTWRDVRLESVMRSIADIDGHRRSTPIYGKTSYCNANPELGRANCIIRFSAPFHRLSSSTPNSVHSQPKL